MNRTCVFTMLLVAALLGPVSATAGKQPAAEIKPTGCASRTFEVTLESSRDWGIVPFRATFTAAIQAGVDSIEAVYWTFGEGEEAGVAGTHVAHRFVDPVDYEVTAHLVTTNHGVVSRKITISGYRAVLSLVFDDGHKTALTDALPLLQSYGLTATAYIVTSWPDVYPDHYMTWDEIAILRDAGWDIGSHSVTHPSLALIDPVDAYYEISQSRAQLRSKGFNAPGFSLPHESYSEQIMDMIKPLYESCKTVRGLNASIDHADPYMIRSYTSQTWKLFDYHKARLDSVIDTGGWYVINNHLLMDDCHGESWCVNAWQIAEVIEYALANRVKIANIDEVMKARRLAPSASEGTLPLGATSPPVVEVLNATSQIHLGPAEVRYRVLGPAYIGIDVYDVRGRRIESLTRTACTAGEHTVTWDGRNDSGQAVASGHYFMVFRIGDDVGATARVVVLR